MADIKEFGYYIKGNRLALVQKDIDSSLIDGKYSPDYTAQWASPGADIDNGLQFEYSLIPRSKEGKEITNENDDIDISRTLGDALAAYLKYKSFQEVGKIDFAMYWLKEYEKLVSESFDDKVIGVRRVITDNMLVK